MLLFDYAFLHRDAFPQFLIVFPCTAFTLAISVHVTDTGNRNENVVFPLLQSSVRVHFFPSEVTGSTAEKIIVFHDCLGRRKK